MPDIPIIRYFDWNYETDTLIEYKREGECNNCGACCTTIIKFHGYNKGLGQTNPVLGWNNRNGEFIKATEGQYLEVRVGDKSRYFYNMTITGEPDRCKMLTDDNRCKIHQGKSLLSRAWPLHPDHVSAFPECSYSFVEVNRWKISELENA